MIHQLEIHSGYSNCGDGCCDDWYTNVYWNGKLLGGEDDVGMIEEILMNESPEVLETNLHGSPEYYEQLFARIGIPVSCVITDTTSKDMDDHQKMMQKMDEFFDEGDDE